MVLHIVRLPVYRTPHKGEYQEKPDYFRTGQEAFLLSPIKIESLLPTLELLKLSSIITV